MRNYQISEKLLILLFDYFLLEHHTKQNETLICNMLNEKHDAIMRRKEYAKKLIEEQEEQS